MFMLDPMVVLRALVLLLSNPQMMSSTPSNSSTVTIGKVAPLKSVRIDSLAQQDLGVAVASVVVAALEAALEHVAALVLEEGSVVDLPAVGDMVVAALAVEHLVVLTEEPELLPQHPTHSPTTPLLARREVRLSMSEM
jgi:hypothetical protein